MHYNQSNTITRFWKYPTHTLLISDFTIDIRDSAVDKNDLDPKIIELLASHTIAALFSNVMGPSVRRSLVPLFEYSMTHTVLPLELIPKIVIWIKRRNGGILN